VNPRRDLEPRQSQGPRPPLTAPLRIGDVEIANRVLLAPLAGIGNWFVRLQARRHGAGLVYSEMISSFAVQRGNRRTLERMLVVHPDEHPVAIQLFGHDPEAMRAAAAVAADAGADLIDINMGCPVRKVCRTGAGAALLDDFELALDLARAAGEGSGRPVTVKLRSGRGRGDRAGLELATRLVAEAGVAGITLHPRPAAVHHSGAPEYGLVRELAGAVEVPVIVSGGLRSAALARRAYAESGADAVMIARGSLGWPWIFGELTGGDCSPAPAEIAAELLWVIDRAEEHMGGHAVNWMRKLYPWYLEYLGVRGPRADAFQRVTDLDEVRLMVAAAARDGRPACAAARARIVAAVA
jgi:nifR3 family TIM-barrel protein